MAKEGPHSATAHGLAASHADPGEGLWQDLVNEFTVPLTGFFAKRIADRSEVDDLVQEVFLRLVQRRGDAEISHVHGYVFQVARSVLNDRLRKGRVRHTQAHDSFDEELHAGSDFSPERVYLGREDIGLMIAALETLPQRTQDVFVLRAFENKKYADVAALMSISVRAAEKHMAKALAHIGEALTREEEG